MMNLPDALFGKTAALQAPRVEPIGVRSACRCSFRERQDVFGYGCSAADIRMRANPNVLMHRTQRPYYRPFFDSYMTAEGRTIHQHHVIADYRIVAYMRVGHNQRVTANTSQSSAFYCAARQRHRLAD